MAYINGNEVLFASNVNVTEIECEQVGIFEVIRDENAPAIKIGGGTEFGESDSKYSNCQTFIKLCNADAPALFLKTKDGVDIIQISPSQLFFKNGDYATIGKVGDNNFTLSLGGGKIRTNNAVATENAFAVGWGTWEEQWANSFNPFEVIADATDPAIKVGNTTITETQLKAMLSILNSNFEEVGF
jgi:hypothetical protein